jgi:putative SOS response-associated peptidase YedK
MPVILPEEIEDEWLKEIDPKSDLDIKELKQLCIPFPDDALKAHSVKQLKGKSGIGNVPESSDEFVYEDMELEL